MAIGWTTILVSALYAIGIYILINGLWNSQRSTQASAWPTAPGTLLNVSLKEEQDEGSTSYEVKVMYTYTVNGSIYEGSRLAFGYSGSLGRKPHQAIYQKLLDAQSLAVRYNPLDPSESCLSSGFHRSIQSSLAFALFWLMFTIPLHWMIWLSSQQDVVLLNNLITQ